MNGLLHTVGGYEPDGTVLCMEQWLFFLFSVAILCADSNL